MDARRQSVSLAQTTAGTNGRVLCSQ
ncbi:hypothetical protein DSM3645_03478 [Blastopirellula marina DSM 3645]|uniref:Uncharacterized protein n=1 Tax=Blastopirellula marina DSM 3645 TaxID=314230 RepID=A3ZW09_9BACT|nr:hypothetical protein DSM3645_03478 [Blastopirellula marina DSM 3645]